MEPELRQFIRRGRSAKLPGGLGLSGRPPARETSWNLTRPEAFILCTAGSARLLCQTSTMADPAPMGPQPSGSLSFWRCSVESARSPAEYNGAMPLTLRPTGLQQSAAFAHLADWVVFEDGKSIGRIYEQHAPASPDQAWFWSITVPLDMRAKILTSGRVPTVETTATAN